MTYKFRQPHRCQNGHFNYLYFELHGDKLVNHRWGEPKCNCPKWNIGEGYSSIGEPEMFTCLHDRNGKEIYKGDICERRFMQDGTERVHKYVVKYDCGSYWCERIGARGISSSLGHYCTNVKMIIEVIGNIHENPELLEEC
jgi:hypothetical protein